VQGPQGNTGAQGAAGPRGETGAQGPEGATGRAGYTGPRGETGPQGPEGATGPQGRTGQAGAQGPQGPTGEQGKPGEEGPQGRTGPRGDTGTQGPVGQTGPEGRTGPRGQTGAQGPTGEIGPQGPTGLLGESLAQTITLLTGGKIRTNDEDARFDADGLWLKSAGDGTYRPEASIKFYTGTWTSKVVSSQLGSYYSSSTETEYAGMRMEARTGRNTAFIVDTYAFGDRSTAIQLEAAVEDANKYAGLYANASPTGSSIGISAEKLTITNAALDLQKAKFLTGSPATGYARLAVRATGAGNSKEQLVIVFKTGAVQVITTEP